MRWDKLNRFELQAMRKILMLDVSEAAEYIGKVSNRSWQYWESGKNPIPSDISGEIYALISQHNVIIDNIVDNAEDQQPTRWYHTYSDFQKDYKEGNRILWKLHQSVVAFIFSKRGNIELSEDVSLDKKSYIYTYFSGKCGIYYMYKQMGESLKKTQNPACLTFKVTQKLSDFKKSSSTKK